ncbi:MAG TPA: ABC transporter permease [Candidatus Methylomirabilis sp.]|nr:ABC transporter permease [Candidatus Methylomirabilis sp.]
MSARALGYLIQRVARLALLLVMVAFVVFVAIRLVPGDPAAVLAGADARPEDVALIRHEMGLDRPTLTQFGLFLTKAVQGDFGQSLRSHRPVIQDLGRRFPASFWLATLSLAVAMLVGTPLGVMAAIRRGTAVDFISMLLSVSGVCMPTFWLGLLLITLFSARLGWLPSSGWEGARYLVLPVITLAAYSMASIARTVRSCMLDVLRQDYVRTARAKGLLERVVVARHAFANALVPVIAVVSLQYGYLLGSSVVTETVFAWPGIGSLLIDAIKNRDYPVVQAAVLLIGALFAIINLASDFVYAWADPRIRKP